MAPRNGSYERTTRGKKYQCVNGLRQVQINREAAPDFSDLDMHQIRRARRPAAEREAARIQRMQKLAAEMARNERMREEEILRDRNELRRVAQEIAAVQLGDIQREHGHMLQVERATFERERDRILREQMAAERERVELAHHEKELILRQREEMTAEKNRFEQLRIENDRISRQRDEQITAEKKRSEQLRIKNESILRQRNEMATERDRMEQQLAEETKNAQLENFRSKSKPKTRDIETSTAGLIIEFAEVEIVGVVAPMPLRAVKEELLQIEVEIEEGEIIESNDHISPTIGLQSTINSGAPIPTDRGRMGNVSSIATSDEKEHQNQDRNITNCSSMSTALLQFSNSINSNNRISDINDLQNNQVDNVSDTVSSDAPLIGTSTMDAFDKIDTLENI